MLPARRRCECRVSAGFLLLCLWFGWACGWQTLAVVLLAAGVHEGGHLLALRLLGARVRGFRVGLLGAVLETDSAALSYPGELLAVLAGPGANLLLALLCRRQAVLAGSSIVLGLFNLLPLPALDGGRALELLLTWMLGVEAGERIGGALGRLFALALGAGLLYLMVRTGGSFWLLPPCIASFGAVGKKNKKNRIFL